MSNNPSFDDYIYDLVHCNRQGLTSKEIAEKIHKPHSTLLREANPKDKGAKLGAADFFKIISISYDGDFQDLKFSSIPFPG